jgi:hypothetical protein
MKQERELGEIHLTVAREAALAMRQWLRDAPPSDQYEPVDVVALATALYLLGDLQHQGKLEDIGRHLEHYARKGLEPPSTEE